MLYMVIVYNVNMVVAYRVNMLIMVIIYMVGGYMELMHMVSMESSQWTKWSILYRAHLTLMYMADMICRMQWRRNQVVEEKLSRAALRADAWSRGCHRSPP